MIGGGHRRRQGRNQAGPRPSVGLVRALHLDGEGKTLAWSTLDAIRDAVLDAGIASEDELDAALEQLAAITQDIHSLDAGPHAFQLWSRR